MARDQSLKRVEEFVRQVLRDDLHQRPSPAVVRDVALKVAKALPPQPNPQKPAARDGKRS